MKPEHGSRRTIIREWMSLPPGNRKTAEQAVSFADKAASKHNLRCSGDRRRRILAWLWPRTGKT